MLDAQRRMTPDAYRLISLGIGLDGISVPDPTAFELRTQLSVVADAERSLTPVAAA